MQESQRTIAQIFMLQELASIISRFSLCFYCLSIRKDSVTSEKPLVHCRHQGRSLSREETCSWRQVPGVCLDMKSYWRNSTCHCLMVNWPLTKDLQTLWRKLQWGVILVWNRWHIKNWAFLLWCKINLCLACWR